MDALEPSASRLAAANSTTASSATANSTTASNAAAGPPAANAANTWTPPPLRPGQLAPTWRLVFIAGWVGVIAGFGAIWQATRIAGIAPWWLGPETEMRSVFVVALPFLAPLVTLVAAVMGLRASCYIGIVAGVISASIAFGDLHYPGLAVVEVIVGLCGILISVACLGGRMRAASPSDTPTDMPFAPPPAPDVADVPTHVSSEVDAVG